MDQVISEERAQEILDQFTEYYDIDPETMPENLQRVIASSLAKIKKAIRDGRLEIETDGQSITVKQNLQKPPAGVASQLTYKEVTGAAKIGIKDDSTDYGKIYTFLGALTGDGVGVIQKLGGKDLSLAESLGVVFLQA
jgi:hypothetical protein